MTLSYDGTGYAGWQVQSRHPSVQQTLEEVLSAITEHSVKVHGSGRTDRGVHARGQVAHVDLTCRLSAEVLMRALNARLPADIRVLRMSVADPDFHARRSAQGKEYRYSVWNGPIVMPERRFYVNQVTYSLDLKAMQRAAAYFVGQHDFVSFTANGHSAVLSTVRMIFDMRVSQKGREILFRVKGEGFLYKQVRSMVGFLLRVGEGAEQPEAVRELLAEAAPRQPRVPSAPAQGLCLWRVWY